MTTRCIDGRLFEHRPFPDDPDFEHDVGPCPRLTDERCPHGDCPEGGEHLDAEDVAPLPLAAYAEPPSPFCPSPKRCAGKGYCPREIACNE